MFFAKSDLEIEAVDVGNMITVLSNFGVMNIGAEKMADNVAAASVKIVSGFFQRKMKRRRLDESKSSP